MPDGPFIINRTCERAAIRHIVQCTVQTEAIYQGLTNDVNAWGPFCQSTSFLPLLLWHELLAVLSERLDSFLESFFQSSIIAVRQQSLQAVNFDFDAVQFGLVDRLFGRECYSFSLRVIFANIGIHTFDIRLVTTLMFAQAVYH